MLYKFFKNSAAKLGGYLCKKRGNKYVEALNEISYIFHRKLNNQNWNMRTNGELRVLRTIATEKKLCVFDVGANVGKWSKLVKQLQPDSTIHAFEIVPSTYGQFIENTKDLDGLVANNVGLSNETGAISINIGKWSTSATGFKIEGMGHHDDYYTDEVECQTIKGIDYLESNSIERIDYLKIDAEGMDLRVIKGFEDRLGEANVIQFEYGIFNIASHDLLVDFCNHLKQHDFIVGKIFPTHVKFFDFHWKMENFWGGNFLAVQKNNTNLINKLKNSRDY